MLYFVISISSKWQIKTDNVIVHSLIRNVYEYLLIIKVDLRPFTKTSPQFCLRDYTRNLQRMQRLFIASGIGNTKDTIPERLTTENGHDRAVRISESHCYQGQYNLFSVIMLIN